MDMQVFKGLLLIAADRATSFAEQFRHAKLDKRDYDEIIALHRELSGDTIARFLLEEATLRMDLSFALLLTACNYEACHNYIDNMEDE